MPLSDYMANVVLDAIANGGSLPTTMYIAYATGALAANEVTGGNAARIQIHLDGTTTPHWAAAASRAVSNADVIDSAEGGGDAVVSHLHIYDAASAGNLLGTGQLVDGASNPVTVTWTSSTVIRLAVGALTLSIAS